jgi:hypothetical protein
MPVDNPRINYLLKKLFRELDREFYAELSKRLADARKARARKPKSAPVRKSRTKKAP